jgi:hypothetical protein
MMRVLLFCLLLHPCRRSGVELPALNGDGSVEDAVDEGGNAGAGIPDPMEEDVGGQEGGSRRSPTDDTEGAELLLHFMCSPTTPSPE